MKKKKKKTMQIKANFEKHAVQAMPARFAVKTNIRHSFEANKCQ